MAELTVIPLGGMGSVTQNMFVYEYEDEMLIVDCGIGFPDTYMPGVDILIPDTQYVFNQVEKGKRIIGMLFTHGHDDHIAAAPYILPRLPDFPIYASPLTAKFAERRLLDSGVNRSVQQVHDTKPVHLSPYFSARFIPVTHSVPDTRHLVISTPIGTIYHGSDFKLDTNPVDGKHSDLATMQQVAADGIHCMMIDCLRVENAGHSTSESAVGPTILQTMQKTSGKYVVTLMSSHIHRIQQVIAAAEKCKRKVVFVGRSVEQNVSDALELKKLQIPTGMQVDKKKIDTIADDKLCVVVAGSQGQEGSSMMRAIYGEHPVLQITERDTVVFSADAIPGNEVPYYMAIDELSRNGVHVIYPSVQENLHSSGHAGRLEQQEIVKLIKPKFVMPIGGADRHRFKFYEYVAEPLGLDREHVLLPENGDIIGFDGKSVRRVDTLSLRPQVVDGLGIGDVGPVVLSDRRTLGQSGIVTVVIPRSRGQLLLDRIEVVSRGFIFMKEAEEVIEYIKQTVAELVSEQKKVPKDEELKRLIEKRLARRLYKIIRREPMIVPVILNID